MKNLLLAAALVVVSGCGSLGETVNHPAAHVVVRAGVAEYIDQDADTARSVIAWTEDVMALIDGNPEILLTELRDRAMELIPWDGLSPAQQIIAIETLRYVETQIAKRIEAGELPADAKVTLLEFLETARWSAEFQLALATQ